MNTGLHTVFVYGTLKRGYWNNRRLANSEFVGQATTMSLFHLRNIGFPIAYLDGPTLRSVKGELWRVDDATLASLDSLEGVPHHYQRIKIQVFNGKGPVKAWIYVQDGDRLNGGECSTEDGCYVWWDGHREQEDN